MLRRSTPWSRGWPRLRVDAKTFRREVAASQDLRDVFDRYLYVQLAQLAQTAWCTRFHVVDPGWLGGCW